MDSSILERLIKHCAVCCIFNLEWYAPNACYFYAVEGWTK